MRPSRGSEELEGEDISIIVAFEQLMSEQIVQQELGSTNEGGIDGTLIEDLDGEGGKRLRQEAIIDRDEEGVVPNRIRACATEDAGGSFGGRIDKGDGVRVHFEAEEAGVFEILSRHDGELEGSRRHGKQESKQGGKVGYGGVRKSPTNTETAEIAHEQPNSERRKERKKKKEEMVTKK